MQKFLIERELPGAGRMTPAEFKQVARKSVNVLRELGTDIQWVHSYVTGDKLYCVYLAEDAEIIREAPCRPLAAARRKAETLRFARRAARRLAGDLDPGLAGLD